MPGLHKDVPYEVYASWDALRSSYLSKFKRSPRHALSYRLNPREPSAAMNLGTAIHSAVLEPEMFEKEYAAAPKVDRRTKPGKATWAEFLAQNPKVSVLSSENMDTCLRIRESVWSEPWAEALLGGKGENELCAVWQDPEFKVACKCRVDRFSASRGAIIDLKTTRDASREAFGRAIENYDYHVQAAFYLDGFDAISPHPRTFLWIAIEKEPPYGASVGEADSADLEEGRRRYKAAIGMHLEAERTGVWPGYPSEIQIFQRPPWARRSGGDADEF